MKLSELKARLAAQPEHGVVIVLPDGGAVPRHFHVTEVGLVTKKFVDCGGTFRASTVCVLQAWTGRAEDDGHRLTAGRLAHILGLARGIFSSEELPVEVEYEAGVVSQFPVVDITAGAAELTLRLGSKHTDCLAREKCGAAEGEGCCGGGEPEGDKAVCGGAAEDKGCC